MIRTLKNDDPLAVAVVIKTGSPRWSVVSIEEFSGWTGGCETCSYWDEGFSIYVNGEVVFEQRDTDDLVRLLYWLSDAEQGAEE